MASATTYTDLRTGTVKPLHRSYGFTNFTLPTSDSNVSTAAQLRNAWTAGNNQNINLSPGTYEIASTLKGTADRIVVDGGSPATTTIKALSGFSGSHFCEWELGQDVIFKNITFDANGIYLISLIWDRCENVLFDNVVVKNSARLGFKSGASSYWTVNNCKSFGHTLHHGIGTKDDALLTHNFSILGSEFHGNSDYGIDLHGAQFEVAGNLVFSNRNCLKMPDSIDGWIHDNRLIEGTSGLGAIFVYDAGLGRTPDNLNIYRNDIWADQFHLRSEDNSTIYWQDNTLMNKAGTAASNFKQAGDNTADIIFSKNELDDYPDVTGITYGFASMGATVGATADAEKIFDDLADELTIGAVFGATAEVDAFEVFRAIPNLKSRMMVA